MGSSQWAFKRISRLILIGVLAAFSACNWNGCVRFPPKGPIEFVGELKPFFFDTVGNTGEFTVEISDMANYELALIAEEAPQCVFPVNVASGVLNDSPLKWKLDVSVWRRGRMVEHHVFDRLETGELFEGDRHCLEVASLDLLTSLKSLIGTEMFIVKVRVLAVDERYTDKSIPVRVGIRRSARI